VDWRPNPEDEGKTLKAELIFSPGPFQLDSDTVVELPAD
jgi:hypothetical protein